MSIVREAFVGSVMCRPPSTPPVMFQMHPGVHVAERQVAGLRLLLGAVDVVEDPAHLRAREVGGQRQPDLVLVPLGAAAEVAELLADGVGAGVLPDDRVVHRLAGGLVPHQRRLALVRDADGGDVRGVEVGLGERAGDDLAGVVPDLGRVVLDPARPREDLLVFLLVDVDHAAVPIEDHAPGGRGALVDRGHVLLTHLISPGRWCRDSGTVTGRCGGTHDAAALTASIRVCAPMALNSSVAMIEPMRGPTTGTQE